MNGSRAANTMGLCVLLFVSSHSAVAQQVPLTDEKPSHKQQAQASDTYSTRIYVLKNATSFTEANEILTAVRLLLPSGIQALLVPSARSIALHADPSDLDLAGRLIESFDRPQKSYRLTYTFVDKEGTKPVGQQHVSLVIVAGQRTQMKGGDRLPIAVKGASADGTKAPEVTYIDVGVNVDVTGDEVPNGLRLRSKVERTTAAEERSSAVVSGDPILRQSVLEDTALVPLMKPMQLGTLDVPGSTRTVEVSVTAEPLP